jgi:elongation factor Tu
MNMDIKDKKPVATTSSTGHVDHGKTTLSAAITRRAAEKNLGVFKSYDQIDNAPEERMRGITIKSAHLTFSTENRRYLHVDCPGHADYVKNMITGASQTDFFILVVALNDGALDQTKEHVRLLSQTGVRQGIVYLNKIDLLTGDEEDRELTCEMIQMEIAELLDKNNIDSSKVEFIRGSARAALAGEQGEFAVGSIDKIFVALDSLPLPQRDVQAPFLLFVEGVASIPGRGSVITGKIEKGSVKIGESLSLIGMDQKTQNSLVVTGIESFKVPTQEAFAGDNIGLLLRGLKNDHENKILKGQAVCKPNTAKDHDLFEAEIYVAPTSEGGRSAAFFPSYRPQAYIHLGNTSISEFYFPKIDEKDGKAIYREMAMPGDNFKVCVKILHKMVMNKGDRFVLREGGRTVASGIITACGDEVKEKDFAPKVVAKVKGK